MDWLFEQLEHRLHNNLPFAVYRLPGTDQLVYLSGEVRQVSTQELKSSPGFLLAPFDTQKDSWFMYAEESRRETFPASGLQSNTPGKFPAVNSSAKKQYEEKVSSAVAAINRGDLKKVVLSRKEHAANTHSLSAVFRSLLMLYPSAFCYWWYHPETKSWMGASPELLLETNGTSFHTVSLAGTQEYSGKLDVEWGDKERVEQEIVTDYIMNQLVPVTESIHREEASTVQAGRLLHLKTRIGGELIPGSWQPVVEKLHPTPAVCGYPTEQARRYLLKHEGYDREFYTGYLGPVAISTAGDSGKGLAFFVNLRCMKIDRDAITVFVGGGVTADSDPEKEWEETVAKTGTMLKVLANSTI
ncbi:chorismate-binding protein [Zeaxanthinibacter sp. PT1]|uniref:chorismate-binding protein n=1 Tax=Zeaxanthinibacter TaxID=561554 RepID=UPI00234A2283|nr:chorismate-binding protein [Zeaxanthinibacter sp. PT1]MDC6351683.1 chorismate-binding protein [Zeaxanthinibacter sp. PT1]